MLVSVVIPVYNVEDYLDECLESVIQQSYEHLEIVLVDDGSTDGSGQKCDEWAAEDPRIIAVHQKNRGLNGARQSGFLVSSGACITFLDGDDLLQDNFIERLTSVMQETQTDIAVCAYQRFLSPNEIVYQEKTGDAARYNKSQTLYYYLTGMTYWGELHTGYLTNVPNKLFRRSVVESIDWSLSDYSIGEDDFWALCAFSNAESVSVIDEALYYYRKTPRSNSINPHLRFKRAGEEITAFDLCNDFRDKAIKLLGSEYLNEIYFRTLHLFNYYLGLLLNINAFSNKDLAALQNAFAPNVEHFLSIKKHPVDKEVLEAVREKGIASLISYRMSDCLACLEDLNAQNKYLNEMVLKQQSELQRLLKIGPSARRLAGNIKRKLLSS